MKTLITAALISSLILTSASATQTTDQATPTTINVSGSSSWNPAWWGYHVWFYSSNDLTASACASRPVQGTSLQKITCDKPIRYACWDKYGTFGVKCKTLNAVTPTTPWDKIPQNSCWHIHSTLSSSASLVPCKAQNKK